MRLSKKSSFWVIPLTALASVIYVGCPMAGTTDDNGSSPVPVSHTLTYTPNAADSGNVPPSQTATAGSMVTVAHNTGGLARSGFTFDGWNTAADGNGISYATGASYTLAADVTLYAAWSASSPPPENYTLTYDANGATAGTVPDSQTAAAGSELVLADNSGGLTRDWFVFGGWNTAADGNGTSYTGGDSYTLNADATLYAVWSLDAAKVVATDGTTGDGLGFSAAIDGDYAIVGAWAGNGNATSSGNAYVFRRTGPTTWDEGTEIFASDGVSADEFGVSVAISGDYAIVGASEDDDNGHGSGSAYVFRRTGVNTWDSGTKITASDAAMGDSFGQSVAISGDYAIVGASQDDDDGSNSGSAYVFRRTGTNAWDTGTKLTADDGAQEDFFGRAVAISGEYAIVGAWADDDNGLTSGSAYVFRRTGTTTWDSGTKLTASDGSQGDNFGRSVAISGEYAIVGASGDNVNGAFSGSAYVFRRTGTTSWDSGIKLTPTDGDSSDGFGESVGITGEVAIVGAFGNDDDGSDSGSAYVFNRTGTNAWSDGIKLTASDGQSFDEFGWSVALAGDYVVVGAPGDSDKGTRSGSAYMIRKP